MQEGSGAGIIVVPNRKDDFWIVEFSWQVEKPVPSGNQVRRLAASRLLRSIARNDAAQVQAAVQSLSAMLDLRFLLITIDDMNTRTPKMIIEPLAAESVDEVRMMAASLTRKPEKGESTT